MTNLIECQCTRCGSTGDPILSYAGPHIKATCNDCGSYIKFIDKSIIPDIKIIKQRIMVVANGDIEKIKKAKDELGIFYDGISGMAGKFSYWSLYLKLK